MAEAMEIDDDQMGNKNYDVLPERKVSPKEQKRLEYLLEQAEIFSHFVGKSPKQAAKRKLAQKREKNANTNRRHERNAPDDEIEDADDKVTGTRFETTPSYINGEMRDYQVRGLNWLISLYERNVNGILADEMGLGKTLQTISILGFLKHYRKIDGPFLVVGPKSTLRNWYNEVKRFCPTMKPIILIGEKTARADVIKTMQHRTEWDTCLTTYEMCLSEKGALKRFNWQYLVVDEAHRLKNENSKLSTILRQFTSVSRLLLTGTPLQNNLHELWALLNFLLPDVFASADDFDTWFDSNDCLRGQNDVANRLRKILRPFMLRRIKADVEKSLLPKIEMKLFVGLTELQKETYKKVLVKEVKKMNEFGEESAKAINNIVMELRKAANHPYLIDGVEPGPPYTTDDTLVNCCGKMMVLDKLLARLKSQGSRVVLFSQFQIMLDILEDYLIWRGHEYRRLDGNTPYEDRANNIDEFNAENSQIFVYAISTRAGGLGINLATADTVIIYDSDWNPQPDFQAIDRVHRIGQKKQVRVFRLISENTVDERIVQRAEIKQRLDKMIIQHGGSVDKAKNDLTKGMKRDMIRFGADAIMSPNGTSVIDVDIDKILKEGEIKTAEENAKYAKYGESELRNLTLEEASSVSVYEFEGCDFRGKQNKNETDKQAFDFRQRKVVSYVLPSLTGQNAAPRNMKFLNDFQFYPQVLWALCEEPGWINLAKDTEQKEKLMAEGFPNWKRQDVKTYCDGLAKYGHENFERIAEDLPGKSLDDVMKYHKTFWARGRTEVKSFDTFIYMIKRQENRKKREEENKIKQKAILKAFEWKMRNTPNPRVEISVKQTQSQLFTKEQDTFILNSVYKHGITNPDTYHLIRREVLTSKKFNFDFFLRTRKAAELEDRSQILLNAIRREYLAMEASTLAKNTSNRQSIDQ